MPWPSSMAPYRPSSATTATVWFGAPGETQRPWQAHPEASDPVSAAQDSASSAPHRRRRWAASSRTRKSTASRETLHDAKGKWIDALAGTARTAPSPGRPWARALPRVTPRAVVEAGRSRCRAPRAAWPSRPKGYRLAIAHYNGASLWFPNTEASTGTAMSGKGSHLARHLRAGRALRRDGSTQENAMHGMAHRRSRQHAQCRGYPSKVRSLGLVAGTATGCWRRPVPTPAWCGRSATRTVR